MAKTGTTSAEATNRLWRITATGAGLGAIGGLTLALIDGTQSASMFIAYAFLVVPAMAIIGGLIAANCVPIHED